METKNYTLASALEDVAFALEGSKFINIAWKGAEKPASYLHEILGINTNQAFILAVMFKFIDRNPNTEDFASFADVSTLRILGMQSDFDELSEKGMIYHTKKSGESRWLQTFALSEELVHAVRYNEGFKASAENEFNTGEVIEVISRMLDECDRDRMDYSIMVTHIDKVIDNTQHLELSRKLREQDMDAHELTLLLIAIDKYVNKDEHMIVRYDYKDIIPNMMQQRIIMMFKDGKGILYEKKFMEAIDEDCDSFYLTAHALKYFLSDSSLEKIGDEEVETDNISERIVRKEMFYNARESSQIQKLAQLLEKENFAKVQQRMHSAGMRAGFACLFYGMAGTGKTETVMQIARRTGRELIQVNVGTLKDKFVGESEKNIQKVFDEYREKLKKSEAAPILLFNEADGIFGKRFSGINSEVEQMSNTIQNIILQNMETFEGIMIATTNLTDNLDKAFERRFLYKIEFSSPTPEVRKKIWMSMLPELKDSDAETLATEFTLSGGQIENAVRKHIVESIIYDSPLSLDSLRAFCREEKINGNNTMKIKKFSA